MAFQGNGGRLLNTQDERRAFCSEYKDQLYNLAYNLTHDRRQAYSLVVGAFQHAFLKYDSAPCPDDCLPFLSSAVYLLYATGDEANDDCSYIDHSKKQSAGFGHNDKKSIKDDSRRYFRRQQKHPVPEYISVQEGEPVESGFDAAVEASAGAAESEVQRPETEGPRHAHPQQTNSSQPLSHQVFDPAHTDYWTPSMEQQQRASIDNETVSPVSDSVLNTDTAPVQPVQQPNFSQAYMYDKTIAKKKKSPALRLINTLLFFLLVWMLTGLLIRTEVLPQWNLGYAWFNLYIFPLF